MNSHQPKLFILDVSKFINQIADRDNQNIKYTTKDQSVDK